MKSPTQSLSSPFRNLLSIFRTWRRFPFSFRLSVAAKCRSGKGPRGCQGCHRRFSIRAATQELGDGILYLHMKVWRVFVGNVNHQLSLQSWRPSGLYDLKMTEPPGKWGHLLAPILQIQLEVLRLSALKISFKPRYWPHMEQP